MKRPIIYGGAIGAALLGSAIAAAPLSANDVSARCVDGSGIYSASAFPGGARSLTMDATVAGAPRPAQAVSDAALDASIPYELGVVYQGEAVVFYAAWTSAHGKQARRQVGTSALCGPVRPPGPVPAEPTPAPLPAPGPVATTPGTPTAPPPVARPLTCADLPPGAGQRWRIKAKCPTARASSTRLRCRDIPKGAGVLWYVGAGCDIPVRFRVPGPFSAVPVTG